MIDAYFDASVSRMASVSGVYQYDTGQRLRLRGLPSQMELTGIDNFIDTIYDDNNKPIPDEERLAVVEVHFAHEGDSQADMRLAIWDIDEQCWTVDVPDEYLTISMPVHAYITVYHGELVIPTEVPEIDPETGEPMVDKETGQIVMRNEYRTRGQTEYEAVFTPIHRSAPSNTVTQEQIDQWTEKQEEIEDGLGNVPIAIALAEQAATDGQALIDAINAEGSADAAVAAAQAAQAALDEAEAVDASWAKGKLVVTEVASGSPATASISETDGVKTMEIGMPKGDKGERGEAGAKGPTDIDLDFRTDGGVYALKITKK